MYQVQISISISDNGVFIHFFYKLGGSVIHFDGPKPREAGKTWKPREEPSKPGPVVEPWGPRELKLNWFSFSSENGNKEEKLGSQYI